MKATEDQAFARSRIDTYYATHYFATVAKAPPFDPADGGAPPAMWNSPVNTDGWVEWKLLPSAVTPEDILALESEFGIQFPPLFSAYLQSYSHLFDQVICGGFHLMLPSVPSDAPLSGIRFYL